MLRTSISGSEHETILDIEGILDAITAPQIRSYIEELKTKKPRRVVANLSQLSVIDASGIAALVSIFKQQRGWGGSFAIKGVSKQPLAIFKLLNLDKAFTLI